MPKARVDMKLHEVHHPLVKKSPDVGGQVGNDHRDLSLTGPITLGFDDSKKAGRGKSRAFT